MIAFTPIQNIFGHYEAPGSTIPGLLNVYEHWSIHRDRWALAGLLGLALLLLAGRKATRGDGAHRGHPARLDALGRDRDDGRPRPRRRQGRRLRRLTAQLGRPRHARATGDGARPEHHRSQRARGDRVLEPHDRPRERPRRHRAGPGAPSDDRPARHDRDPGGLRRLPLRARLQRRRDQRPGRRHPGLQPRR